MARLQINTNQLTSGAWMGDYGSRDHLIPGGSRLDAAQWATRVYSIVITEPATAGDVSLTVAGGLPVAVPAGTFLQSGTNEIIRVTTLAAKGATALAVDPIGQALEDNDAFPFTVTDTAPVTIPGGTVVGRTLTERNAGTGFGPAVDTDDEIFLIVNDVYDASINPDIELYRPNSIVKENFLPQVLDGSMIAGVLTKLRAAYICTRGAA